MADATVNSPPAAAAETLVVACPTDATLNRLPRAKLDRNPKWSTSGRNGAVHAA